MKHPRTAPRPEAKGSRTPASRAWRPLLVSADKGTYPSARIKNIKKISIHLRCRSASTDDRQLLLPLQKSSQILPFFRSHMRRPRGSCLCVRFLYYSNAFSIMAGNSFNGPTLGISDWGHHTPQRHDVSSRRQRFSPDRSLGFDCTAPSKPPAQFRIAPDLVSRV